MPSVLNRHTDTIPPDAIYIGRPSKWGNPFKVNDPLMPSGLTRLQRQQKVVDEYRQYIMNNPELLAQLPELKGKDLVCFCKPLPCHGDILLELANKT